LSVPSDTISGMPTSATLEKPSRVLVSHTGVPLSRSTTFRFTLDPSRAQQQILLTHAGAARLAYNHHIGRVKANLDQRTAERSYGVGETDLTPSLSWSKVSFISHMNAWKGGRTSDAPVALDSDGKQVRGLPWRAEVSTDVFECASVNAATTLANWSKSCTGARAGKAAGFPRGDGFCEHAPRRSAGRARSCLATDRSRVPSTADFLEAVRCGLGWGMVPELQLTPGVTAVAAA
jgi:hypothetical protein